MKRLVVLLLAALLSGCVSVPLEDGCLSVGYPRYGVEPFALRRGAVCVVSYSR